MTNFSETPAGKKLIEKYVEIGEWAIRGIINSAFEQGKQAGREEYENEWFRGDAIRIAVEKGRQEIQKCDTCDKQSNIRFCHDCLRDIKEAHHQNGRQLEREEISEKVRLIDDLIQKIKEKNDGEKDDTST